MPKITRVSEIDSSARPVKPPREIICARCGDTFLVKGHGKGQTKYCIECKLLVYDENTKRQAARYRARQREQKAKEIGNALS